MRPISDKDMEIVDLDQLFDEYVETDLLQQLSNSTADRSSSDSLGHLFDLPSSSGSDVPEISPILDQEEHHHQPAWQPCLQEAYPNQALPISNDSSSFSVEQKTKESLSDSELLTFEDLFELEKNQLRSISQPSTPRPHTVKAVKKAVSFQERTIPRGVQKLSKRASASSFSKMMQPSAYYHRAPLPEVWTRKLDTTAETFNLRTPSHNINSPPLSAKLVHHENGSGFFSQVTQPYTTTQSPLTSPDPNNNNNHEMNSFSSYQLTPQASPAIGVSHDNNDPFNSNMGLTLSCSSVSSEALSALQTPPTSMRLPMTTWGPNSSPNVDFSFAASPGFAGKNGAWWGEDTVQQPTGPNYRESNTRSTSQSTSFNATGLEGLGISCDNSSFGEFGLGIHAQEDMPHGSAAPGSASYEVAGFNTMYPTPPQHHQQAQAHHQIVPIGTRPLSRSPSPNPQPRFHRRRPSTHSHAHAMQSRTQSSTSRRKSTGNGTQHARQSSSGSGGNVGFVNFTPDDSKRILTGVAPSGSSKTKARREKEAAEKRRKLSQAAVKAVMEAGGDVDSLRRLEREGLLVLES